VRPLGVKPSGGSCLECRSFDEERLEAERRNPGSYGYIRGYEKVWDFTVTYGALRRPGVLRLHTGL
jgi:hypothetical protein